MSILFAGSGARWVGSKVRATTTSESDACICAWRNDCCSRPTSGCCGSWPGTWAGRACSRCRSTSARLQARRGLPAVPLRLDHQQLQSPLPGLLGGRGRQAADDFAGRDEPAHRRSQGNGQRLLRHRRRRAVHAPASCSKSWPPIPIAISRSSPTANSSPTRRPSELRQLGNVTPLISVEGNEIVSDERRGRADVLSKTHAGRAKLPQQQGLHRRLHQPVPDEHRRPADRNLDRPLIEMGVMYTWFHVYRPMGPDANPQLCLTPEQQLRARQFVVEMRAKKPIVIIDAYYDGEGQALCPAATGISHHINPWGDIEPCPIVQFTKESIHATRSRPAAAAREVPAIGVPARLPRPGPATTRAAASSWNGPTCSRNWWSSTGRRTPRSAARRWPSWRR